MAVKLGSTKEKESEAQSLEQQRRVVLEGDDAPLTSQTHAYLGMAGSET